MREQLLVQFFLGGPVVSNGSFRFQVTGPVRTNYVVWRSSDLQTWAPLRTNWVIDGLLQFSDPAALAGGPRFYRASVAP